MAIQRRWAARVVAARRRAMVRAPRRVAMARGLRGMSEMPRRRSPTVSRRRSRVVAVVSAAVVAAVVRRVRGRCGGWVRARRGVRARVRVPRVMMPQSEAMRRSSPTGGRWGRVSVRVQYRRRAV
ncbi:hypothetical protein [Nocardiopsis metallicus]|uniref:Uncharacterized protein n=1 Tax=Nocardiopsis metallicus TaxID=179819 RepID=A0A840W119_9ACTN|nr:hypothetical protein [Nocardiopsis metallicus]MBB5490459.1 hypothetical protein [Nocardiopsis metallicus]